MAVDRENFLCCGEPDVSSSSNTGVKELTDDIEEDGDGRGSNVVEYTEEGVRKPCCKGLAAEVPKPDVFPLGVDGADFPFRSIDVVEVLFRPGSSRLQAMPSHCVIT